MVRDSRSDRAEIFETWSFFHQEPRARRGSKALPPLPQRFAAYQEALGDRFVARVLPDASANPNALTKNPHGVVTAHLIDRSGEPTRQAVDEILGSFRTRLIDRP